MRSRLIVVALGVLCGTVFGVPSALAQSPWWHIRSEPEPTYFHGGVAQNEVEELKVEATGGDVLWLEQLISLSDFSAVAFPYNASDQEVESALDGLYGANSVEATGGPVATGTGDLSAATGMGTLSAATGTGSTTASSTEVKEVAVTSAAGAFEAGQEISGPGIPEKATIASVVGTTVTLSAPATATATGVELHAGSTEVAGVVTTSATGAFEVGQSISGAGIPEGTTITQIVGSTLTLSAPATEAGIMELHAASKVVTGVATAPGGTFAVGQEISGAGIPLGTTIATVGAGTLTLSNLPAEAGTDVALASRVPYRLTFKGREITPPINDFRDGGFGGIFPGTELQAPPGESPNVTLTELQKGRPDGEILITATNLGNAPASGCTKVAAGTGKYTGSGCTEAELGAGEYEATPITVSDVLPPGLEAVAVWGEAGEGETIEKKLQECSLKGENGVNAPACAFTGVIPPYTGLTLHVEVDDTGASGQVSQQASVSGGGARSLSVSRPVPLGGSTPFGLADYELVNENEGGSPDTQAGSHPFQQTTTIVLNQSAGMPDFKYPNGAIEPAAIPKDTHFLWPAGLVGNPASLPQCPLSLFQSPKGAECPADTAIGVARPLYSLNQGARPAPMVFRGGLFNLVPSPGEPARFGFQTVNGPVYIDPSVRSGRDYGITVNVENITQLVGFRSAEVTVWGTPGASSFNQLRGTGCLLESTGSTAEEVAKAGGCSPLGESNPAAFLSLPTACPANQATGSPEGLLSTVTGDSWLQPSSTAEQPQLAESKLPALDGCDALPFNPSIVVTPDVETASTPSGLNVDVHVPQQETLHPEGLAEAEPRNITVALPPGVTVNPSNADGLQACTANPAELAGGELGSSGDQIGFQGLGELRGEPGVNATLFTGELPESIAAKVAVEDHEKIEGYAVPETERTLSPGANFCPNASKIGTATVKTPLLPVTQPLTGSVYLAAQESNPFGSLLAMYMVVEDPVSGTLVKLAGEVSLCKSPSEWLPARPGSTKLPCQAAGQIITTFENSPQAPFEDAEIHFFGGERAPLSTPAHCGTYTTTAAFTPWSEAPGEHEIITTNEAFKIKTGPNGGPCPGEALPFKPTVTGGATNVIAGAFSPFTATFSRSSGEQNMQSIEVKLPPGLSGILANVELCPEPQANLGECGPNSLIGETTVSVGVGGDPYTDSGGRFYLTGPYNGTGACKVGEPSCAPFGITFEVPAKAGPFDLANTKDNHPPCDCVLVRGKIEINPITAAITITSNPPGTTDSIPTSIEGIPLEIQHVNAITTRDDFQFNPTSCDKMEFTGTIHSSEGVSDQLGVPFQVTDCEALKFTPKFSVSTSAHTSKANGASLTTKIVYPKGSFGTQANVASVKVELPKQLPSRLTTLQKACVAKVFEEDPEKCPLASKVGFAKSITPVLPVPVEGPAYFVSHGGEAFPSLIIVLKGYGVTVQVVGTTFISKSGITSTTFKTVPDVPFNSFELTLHNGPFSALTSNVPNLCKVKGGLKMPTEFHAQNGAELVQSTTISVTGCKVAKKASKKKKKKKGKGKKKKK
jgi:hypothetical protein